MGRAALIHALVGMALFALSSVGVAQVPGETVTVIDPIDIPPEHDPLAHAWDVPGQRGGFYLRGSTSLGVQNARLGSAAWESDAGYSVSGFATGYGVAVGGFLRPWLALHVDATLGVMWNGDLEEDFGIEGDRQGARILAYGVAPAVTFFTRHHFYLTPAFGVGFATIKTGSHSDTTNPGFYMHLVAGKDLVVDEHFSFGLQLEISYMRLSGEADGGGIASSRISEQDARIRQFLFGVSFGFDSL